MYSIPVEHSAAASLLCYQQGNFFRNTIDWVSVASVLGLRYGFKDNLRAYQRCQASCHMLELG